MTAIHSVGKKANVGLKVSIDIICFIPKVLLKALIGLFAVLVVKLFGQKDASHDHSLAARHGL